MSGFRIALAVAMVLVASAGGRADDWITAPSYFTHGPTGNRVSQHTPIGPFFTYPRGDFERSGIRQTRSSLQFGGSVDHYHSIEEWGRPIRPYDEWRFPFRPYSSPYPDWGPPYGGLGGTGWGAFGGHGPFGLGFGAFPFFPFAIPLPNAAGLPGQQPGLPPWPGNGPGFPPGNVPMWPGNHPQYRAPYPGYRPWFDDRYPAFDDRAPWRHQPFPFAPSFP